MTLVSIVLGASDSDAAYKASEKILEYGFDYFQPVTIEYTGESIARIPVYDQGEKIGYADAVVKGPLLFYAEVLSRKPADILKALNPSSAIRCSCRIICRHRSCPVRKLAKSSIPAWMIPPYRSISIVSQVIRFTL